MSHAARTWRPRETLIDLYNEMEETPSYKWAAALLSAILLMAGFLVFPPSFAARPELSITTHTSFIIAVILVGLSYALSITISLTTHSWLFQLHILYIPNIISSILGLVNTIYNMAIRRGPHWGGFASAAITLAAMSILLNSIAIAFVDRKIFIVRARDASHRQRTSKPTFDFLPETELQRQQLLRLLLQQDAKSADPPSDTKHTFKIDWPSSTERSSRRTTMNNMKSLPIPRSRLGGRATSIYGPSAYAHEATHAEPYTASGLDREVPTIIIEEPTLQSLGEQAPQPLRAVAYERPFSYEFSEPVPSYNQQIFPPLPTSDNLPQLEENGYPIEKPDILTDAQQQRTASTRSIERPLNGYTVVDSPELLDETRRSRRGASGHEREGEAEGRRAEVELLDRGTYGTRNRPELEGDVVGPGLSGSIRRVETDGWGRHMTAS